MTTTMSAFDKLITSVFAAVAKFKYKRTEAAKWNTRKKAALAAIDTALAKHCATHNSDWCLPRTERANVLRAEVNSHCHRRAESIMKYTEKLIEEFDQTGY